MEVPGVTLVIGGAGYIGSILVRRLLERGGRVRVLDNLMYGSAPLADIAGHPNLEIHVGDCRSLRTVVEALRGVRAVVHLAALVGDGACNREPLTTLEINYAATRMISEVAQGNRVSRFVFASSCSVYGASDDTRDEESAPNPVSLYAQTKLYAETEVLRASSPSFQPVVLRLATVFGSSYRPRFDLVVNLLTAKAHCERAITIFNGESWRPFVHVRDVAAAIMSVLFAGADLVRGQTFNVGDSRLNYTLNDIGRMVRDAFPACRVEYADHGDRRNYRVSFDRIRSVLGFECSLTPEQGIHEIKLQLEDGTIADYRNVRYHNQDFIAEHGGPANQSRTDVHVMAAFLQDSAHWQGQLSQAATG